MAYYYHHPLVTQNLRGGYDNTQSDLIRRLSDSQQSSGRDDESALSSVHSSIGDTEWVVFSPPVEISSGGDVGSAYSGRGSNLVEEDSGVSTPLAFPSHDGIGSFTSDELNERVNAWRLDQSELVMQEMTRLEHKYEQPSLMASFGIEDASKNNSYSASSSPGSFWQLLSRRLLYEFIGLDDGIRSLIAGVSLPDVANSDHELSKKASVSSWNYHYRQSLQTGPNGWESQLIDKVFNEIRLPRAEDLTVVRYLHRFLGKYWESEPGNYPEPVFG